KVVKPKSPTHISYEEWDCTALFQATIYARSFATPDSKGHYRTLGELYVRRHKVPHGKFHASVVSPSGNTAETFALAIDQLRLLRNSLCHSERSEIDKLTFDQYVQLAKEGFKALGINTDPIGAIGGLTESNFPTKEDLEDPTERDVVDLLDKPDYPSNLRLKFLFETSFTRLSLLEKEALVSLSVLSQDFNLSVPAAVLDVKSSVEAKKVFHTLRRKSLLDSSCKPDSFSMHKMLLSFEKERGKEEMKETMLNSKALTWGKCGRTMMLLSKAENLTLSVNDKAKLLCYRGICQLASEKMDDGVQNLQEGLSLMGNSDDERIVKVTALQILVTYFRFNKKRENTLELYMAALQECRALGGTSLLIIPPLENRKLKIIEGEKPEPDSTNTGPLRLEMICAVSEATKQVLW
ncbi:hypothetical protein AWC38_SpisGene18863, partial [Stylophora pistillata]